MGLWVGGGGGGRVGGAGVGGGFGGRGEVPVSPESSHLSRGGQFDGSGPLPENRGVKY